MSKSKTSGFEALAHETALYPQEKLALVKKDQNSFYIGIPREIAFQENRICLTPEAVLVLANNGHRIQIEAGAGKKSNFSDKEYSDAGAKIVSSAEETYKADFILKIEPPTLLEIEILKPGQTLISALQIGNQNPQYIRALLSKKVTSLAQRV